MWFKWANPYWSDILKVSFLQRRIIVASIMYYQLDGSTIDDIVYERISKQLLSMMKEMPKEELEKTDYWYCMKDYDGSTGFHLYYSLNDKDKEYLTKIARIVKSSQGG